MFSPKWKGEGVMHHGNVDSDSELGCVKLYLFIASDQKCSQRGAWVHAPLRHHKSIFITAPLVFSMVPYSAPGPRWGLPSPRTPGLSPLSKFLAMPLLQIK